MNGKGDKPRPLSVSKKDFDSKWDKIDWKKGKESKKDLEIKK